jgi:hypothetical protein
VYGHYQPYLVNLMDCGAVAVCGVIVLETGLGDGNYQYQ